MLQYLVRTFDNYITLCTSRLADFTILIQKKISIPGSHSQTYPPLVFRHRPWRQTSGFSRHSSTSTQERPESDKANPSLHSHLKDPSMLMQRPLAHMPVCQQFNIVWSLYGKTTNVTEQRILDTGKKTVLSCHRCLINTGDEKRK